MSEKEKILQWSEDISCVSGENTFVKKLRKGGLRDEHIIVVIDALDDTCKHCFDGESGCQCLNDE